jgi:hypothetical protein
VKVTLKALLIWTEMSGKLEALDALFLYMEEKAGKFVDVAKL